MNRSRFAFIFLVNFSNHSWLRFLLHILAFSSSRVCFSFLRAPAKLIMSVFSSWPHMLYFMTSEKLLLPFFSKSSSYTSFETEICRANLFTLHIHMYRYGIKNPKVSIALTSGRKAPSITSFFQTLTIMSSIALERFKVNLRIGWWGWCLHLGAWYQSLRAKAIKTNWKKAW